MRRRREFVDQRPPAKLLQPRIALLERAAEHRFRARELETHAGGLRPLTAEHPREARTAGNRLADGQARPRFGLRNRVELVGHFLARGSDGARAMLEVRTTHRRGERHVDDVRRAAADEAGERARRIGQGGARMRGHDDGRRALCAPRRHARHGRPADRHAVGEQPRGRFEQRHAALVAAAERRNSDRVAPHVSDGLFDGRQQHRMSAQLDEAGISLLERGGDRIREQHRLANVAYPVRSAEAFSRQKRSAHGRQEADGRASRLDVLEHLEQLGTKRIH